MAIKIIVSNITSSAGTERAVVNLSNNLAKHGHKVNILSLYTTEGEAYYNLNKNVELTHLKIRQSGYLLVRIFWGLYIATKRIYQHINKSKDDTIIGTNHVHNFALAIINLIAHNNKYIGCEHMSFTALRGYTKILVKILYRYLDGLVVLTDTDNIKFRTYVSDLKCVTIPNELSFYPPQPAACVNKKLIAIGRYTYQKGFDLLIDIVAEVFLNRNEWTLTLIGSGELKTVLQAKIDGYKMTDRIFLAEPTKDIIDKYLSSSIYLMTSRYEGLPMVLLEAKACGLPIIAYDCPTGPGSVIKNDDGVLIGMRDSESFKANLTDFIDDIDKRKSFGAAARFNSLVYSSENVYQQWQNLFSSL